MVTREDYWNRRSQIYDAQIAGTYRSAYDQTVALTLQYLKPEDHVLDFACGTGVTAIPISAHVAHVRGIDVTPDMVRKAQNKVAELDLPNVTITQTDIFDPCLEEGSFDAVTAFNILHYLKDLDQVLNRIHRLLKPEGMFFSATDCLGQSINAESVRKFCKRCTGRMPYTAFFRMDQLEKRVADAGFVVLESKNLFPAPPNLFIAAKNWR